MTKSWIPTEKTFYVGNNYLKSQQNPKYDEADHE